MDKYSNEDVAIVGMGLRFPGDANSPESFYEFLVKGRSALSETPSERYNVDSFYHPDRERPGIVNTHHAHYINGDIAAFDAPFFSITPNEAVYLDPQQRGLLETTYHALENAGIPISKAVGSKTAVYMGCFTSEYEKLILSDPEMDIKYTATGVPQTLLSNRLSWFYDFRGPSLTIDTACSSSLNAVHLGCNSLLSGEADMAVVGGCNLMFHPVTMLPLTTLGFLSPDGKCYSFDHRANGYSRGEGFGVIAMKRVLDAVRDGDTIRAVIRGTASNQDGKSPGITQPTRQGQEALIKAAYARAGLGPDETRFFEAHGTGTPIGDPLEAGAISACFSDSRSSDDPIYVGALKTNVGHLEGAAGVAGLIKAALVVERGLIPPNLNMEKINPKIPAEEWNMNFPSQLTVWPSAGLRRASVNSFGFGGSNAHAIVDDAYHYLQSRGLRGNHNTTIAPALPKGMPEDATRFVKAVTNGTNGTDNSHGTNGTNGSEDTTAGNETNGTNGTERKKGTNGLNGTHGDNGMNGVSHIPKSNGISHAAGPRIFLLSSNDENGISRLAVTYRDYLAQQRPPSDEESYLRSLSYTLATKRTHFPWRAFIIADCVAKLTEALCEPPSAVRSGTDGNLALVFTGQGAQWRGMGQELLRFPRFRESILAADTYLKELGSSWSVRDMHTRSDEERMLKDAEYSQPLCTILQVALVDLMSSWSIQPGAVVGHSSGEIAAAYAAGAISRESAWRIAYYRGLLSSKLANQAAGQQSAGVGMMAVGIDAAAAQEYINSTGGLDTIQELTIACFNSPKSVTVSGTVERLDALQQRLTQDSIFNRRLQVENAYHSPLMHSIANEYRTLIGSVEAGSGDDVFPGATPRLYSSLTGRHASLGELQTAAYWVQNLVSPVRFSDAVSRMLSDGVDSTRKLGTKMESPLSSPITELVEVGPHSALQGPLREILGGASASKDVGYATVLRRGENAISTAMLAVGWLYCRGQPVDIERVNSGGAIEKPTKMLVDLPPYPFNHGNTYWRESRLSKGYRFRAHPRHELLGAPVPDWDKNNAMWRNWLRLSENPWVKDHVVAGNVLYPAAGMIVMAIEAMRQLASPDKALLGLRLKDVIFQTALRVPESVDGVETHFNVRPYLDSVSSTSSSWNEFQLSSNNGEGWREHCRGLIQPVYETAVNPVDNGREREQFIAMTSEAVAVAESRCRDRVPSIQVYELLHTIGFDFGKTFQNLTDIAIDTDRGAVATIKAPDTKSQAVAGYVQPHLIHPCTLDAIFQSTIVALTRGGRELGDAVVPTSIKKLWIAVEGSDRAIKDVRVSSKSDFLGMRQMQAASTAVHPVTRRPLLVVEGFEATAISNSHNQAGAEMSHRHLCFNHVWQPDVDIINQEMAVKMFRPPEIQTKVDPTEVIARCEALCYLYLRRYLKVHDDAKLDPSRPWYRKYVGWMHHQFEQHARGELVHARDDWDKLAEDDAYFYELEAEMAEATPEAVMTVAVGRNLEAMLQGALDPLEVFFNTPILEDVYARGTGSQLGYSYIVNYLDNLAHKNSDISILEVGAGTGGATVPILDALTRHGDGSGAPRFGRYDFTDISPSFFDQAKKKFSKTADRMRFRTLNIEKDSFAQGFEPQMYDAIIAANVLHATKNIDETLRNCRKMLKPGGKLILNELTNPEALRTGFGFGLLPGWWLSEEPHRQWGPLMTAADWETHLKRVGFSGVDIYFQDYYDKANHLNGVLVATALGPEPELRPLNPVVLVYDKSSRLQAETAVELERLLSHRAPSCTIVALEELAVTDLSQKVCIFLPELDSLFLDRMDEAQFASLKRMTSEPESLIWITHGGGPASQNPNGDMVNGLAKVVRQENPGIRFVTLAVETVRSAAAVAETALTVIHSALAQRPKLAPDNSFWESDGVLHICRLVEDEHMNQAIAAKTSQQAAAPAPFGADPDRALKLTIGSPGLLDTLQFVDDPRRDVPLAEGEVEFKIAAAGLNFLDVMTALGQVVGNNLGCEGAGVVARTGPNCTLRPGDRVCGIGYWLGAFGTYSRSSELCLARVPDSMSLQAAAGFAVVFVTAYMALYEMANIQKGETVLIHAAAGGVGQACIQLAKLRGAVIFATVGSTAKRDLLMDTYGIPKEHILASRDLTFAQGIRRLTRNRGVDVVVNSLSGDALRATWECMAPFGRFIEVGKVDIYSSARLDMSTFRNNVSFSFIDVSYMCQYKPERFGVIMGQLMQLVEEGHVRELAPITSFSFAQIQDAFRYMQGGSHSGKIVLEPHDDDIVPIVPSRKDLYSFDPEASYLISGGLGGLGRSIARWMASRGAKNLILLSRSGNTNDASRTLVADLEAIGVRAATPPCDVTDATALQDALDRAYADGMPLVKGCIQGSMVLKDALLVNMTLDEYYTAVKPKVHASWNLHNVLPKDLDFFVLLSSISTVWGNRGQANYNIGNAFQDALARYRVLNGWRAHVIDVGMILSVGYVAENKEELVDLMRHIGAEGAREEELHAILNEMCEPPTVADGEAGPSSLLKTQVSLGLQLPEARMLAGLEPCGWMSDPLVRVLHQIRTREGAAETERKTINYGALLSEAASFSAACDVVYDALADKLIKLLNISADDIDPGKPLHDMGVDSLVSVELRTWIMKQLDADVAVFDLMETSSMRKLALLVASRSGLVTNEKNKEEQTA